MESVVAVTSAAFSGKAVMKGKIAEDIDADISGVTKATADRAAGTPELRKRSKRSQNSSGSPRNADDVSSTSGPRYEALFSSHS